MVEISNYDSSFLFCFQISASICVARIHVFHAVFAHQRLVWYLQPRWCLGWWTNHIQHIRYLILQRAGQHDSFDNPGFNQLFIPSACFNDTATRHTLQEEFSRLTRILLATQEQRGKCGDDHKGRLYSIVHVQNPISQIATNNLICAFETGNIFAATASPCFCRPLCEAKFAEVIYVISTLL